MAFQILFVFLIFYFFFFVFFLSVFLVFFLHTTFRYGVRRTTEKPPTTCRTAYATRISISNDILLCYRCVWVKSGSSAEKATPGAAARTQSGQANLVIHLRNPTVFATVLLLLFSTYPIPFHSPLFEVRTQD